MRAPEAPENLHVAAVTKSSERAEDQVRPPLHQRRVVKILGIRGFLDKTAREGGRFAGPDGKAGKEVRQGRDPGSLKSPTVTSEPAGSAPAKITQASG